MFSAYFSFLLQLFFIYSLFALENKHVWLFRLTVIILYCQKYYVDDIYSINFFHGKTSFSTDRPKKF